MLSMYWLLCTGCHVLVVMLSKEKVLNYTQTPDPILSLSTQEDCWVHMEEVGQLNQEMVVRNKCRKKTVCLLCQV